MKTLQKIILLSAVIGFTSCVSTKQFNAVKDEFGRMSG